MRVQTSRHNLTWCVPSTQTLVGRFSLCTDTKLLCSRRRSDPLSGWAPTRTLAGVFRGSSERLPVRRLSLSQIDAIDVRIRELPIVPPQTVFSAAFAPPG